MNLLDRISKNHQTFFYEFLSAEGQTEKGTGITNRISDFGTPLLMRCTSTVDLRNFGPSYTQCSWYHVTVCQVNIDTHAANWKTQMIWERIIPVSNTTLKFNHSESHCDILWLLFLQQKSDLLPDTSSSLWGNYLRWFDECCEHIKNTGIVFMCEFAVTLKLYRATISLSDAD